MTFTTNRTEFFGIHVFPETPLGDEVKLSSETMIKITMMVILKVKVGLLPSFPP